MCNRTLVLNGTCWRIVCTCCERGPVDTGRIREAEPLLAAHLQQREGGDRCRQLLLSLPFPPVARKAGRAHS